MLYTVLGFLGVINLLIVRYLWLCSYAFNYLVFMATIPHILEEHDLQIVTNKPYFD